MIGRPLVVVARIWAGPVDPVVTTMTDIRNGEATGAEMSVAVTGAAPQRATQTVIAPGLDREILHSSRRRTYLLDYPTFTVTSPYITKSKPMFINPLCI